MPVDNTALSPDALLWALCRPARSWVSAGVWLRAESCCKEERAQALMSQGCIRYMTLQAVNAPKKKTATYADSSHQFYGLRFLSYDEQNNNMVPTCPCTFFKQLIRPSVQGLAYKRVIYSPSVLMKVSRQVTTHLQIVGERSGCRGRMDGGRCIRH